MILLLLNLIFSQTQGIAQSTYYTNTSKEELACIIGESINKYLSLKNQTWDDKRQEMIKKLESFSEFAIAFTHYQRGPKSLTKTFINNLTFLSDGAFLDDNNPNFNSKNYLTAYWFMINQNLLKKRNNDSFINTTNQSLENTVSPYLDIINALDTPDIRYFKKDGIIVNNLSTIEVFQDGWFKNHNLKVRQNVFKQIKKMNTISSPLFIWLSKQKRESVSHVDLYTKALEIYKDPFTSLGVISWLFAFESQFPDRNNSALSINAITPILFRVEDHIGTIYHFWGYLTRAILSYPDPIWYLSFRSKVYEGLIQKNDSQDLVADQFGINVAKKTLNIIKGISRCDF